MIFIRNSQRSFIIDVKKMEQQVAAMLCALDYSGFDINIWLTTNTTIKKYNQQFRKKNKETDILSFPYHTDLTPGERITVVEEEDRCLGDIMISLEYVARTCHKWDRDFHTHLTALLAHGIAHLLNYDHITDAEFTQMQIIENKLIKSIKT